MLVAFNTVVGNRTALLQVGQGTDRLGPNECTFANNIFVGGGSGGLIDVDEATGTDWQGNVVWAGTGGNAPSSGYRIVNPNLVNTNGINRLSSGSPAIDAAAGSHPQVVRDLDLQTRLGTKDVGADEFVSGSAPRRPLTRNPQGNLEADPARFPSGMKALGDYIHARGLKFGIYTSAGTKTCSTAGFPGGLGASSRTRTCSPRSGSTISSTTTATTRV